MKRFFKSSFYCFWHFLFFSQTRNRRYLFFWMNYLTLAVQDSESQHSFVFHVCIFLVSVSVSWNLTRTPGCEFIVFFSSFLAAAGLWILRGRCRHVDATYPIMIMMMVCQTTRIVWKALHPRMNNFFVPLRCLFFYLSDVFLQSLFSVLSSLLINFLIHISTVFLFQSYWVCCTFILFNFHFSLL